MILKAVRSNEIIVKWIKKEKMGLETLQYLEVSEVRRNQQRRWRKGPREI